MTCFFLSFAGRNTTEVFLRCNVLRFLIITNLKRKKRKLFPTRHVSYSFGNHDAGGRVWRCKFCDVRQMAHDVWGFEMSTISAGVFDASLSPWKGMENKASNFQPKKTLLTLQLTVPLQGGYEDEFTFHVSFQERMQTISLPSRSF